MFPSGFLREKAVEYQESWSLEQRSSTSSMVRFLALCKRPNGNKGRRPAKGRFILLSRHKLCPKPARRLSRRRTPPTPTSFSSPSAPFADFLHRCTEKGRACTL